VESARTFRSTLFRLHLGLLFAGLTAALFLAGAAFVLCGIYQSLSLVVAPPLAAVLLGLVAFLGGGLLLWVARSMVR
jgi:hypothetical protein